jgi:hypothetical protein
MNEPLPTDELLKEIARYLRAVEVFRAEGCEPTWQAELDAEQGALVSRLAAFSRSAPQPAH